MTLPKTTFTCAGDMLAARLIPTTYQGFAEVADFIKKGDVRFCNLETVLQKKGENYGNQFNGGSFHGSDPRVLKIAREFGFNAMSFANNHTFDFGYGGLISTLDELSNADFVHTGVGRNLDEAAAPAYIETENSRVALISFTASFVNDAALAGRQSRRFPGRPGVNGLRIDEYVQVTQPQLDAILEISKLSKINAQKDIERAEGYFPPLPEGTAVLK
ncbi:MAG: CapA family protein, partial [Clostridia bacterium]|nr:CapA family protein [Clostridia bacterium]